ncbi:MAG: hypothetical protein DHS20C21_00550 [Gemmatimonadota bacterium]|nr:MAG: hypothetical protein DHS20C21_00550 [Gemmatimonadota bacterium]
MKETTKHQRAFEAYYGLGPDRSLPALAAEFGASVAAVKKWSGAFSWQRRVAERDQAVGGLVRERATKAEVDRRSQNRRIIEAGIISVARAIADGRVSPSLSDLDRLVRLQCFVEGEADSRQEIVQRDLAGKSLPELRAMLDHEVRGLGAIDARYHVLTSGDGPRQDSPDQT